MRRHRGRHAQPRIGVDVRRDAVAEGFRRTIAAHGPDSVAFYLSGQLLTEDYYVAVVEGEGFPERRALRAQPAEIRRMLRIARDARTLDAVAEGFRRTIAAHGPDSVAFYLSGQLLTEDY
jgi:anaerobic selenocysteine-containing dehydrogenase